MRISDLGEDGFIGLLGRRFPLVGDDCAVLEGGLLVSVDALVEGTHFVLSRFGWRGVATKAACAGMSDVVAMGGVPEYLFVSLGVSPDAELSGLEEFYSGVEEACSAYGCRVAGGDTFKSPLLFVGMSVLGRSEAPALLRSAASPGESLFVTGFPGTSAVGLEALLEGYPEELFSPFIERHLFPRLRCGFASALARRGLCGAMMDISDGLVVDSWRMAQASSVCLEIEWELLPPLSLSQQQLSLLRGDPWFYVLHGGEEYELLFTSSRESEVLEVASATSTPVHRIGRVVEGEGVFVVREGRRSRVHHRGFSHF